MRTKPTTIFLAELRESFRMAMGALAGHKLRSALTLVGVLVGVFSIIVAMTAMRVLQHDVETEMSGLGTQTFMVSKWPGVYFGGHEGLEKFWRRKNIDLAQGLQLQEKATLARNVGLETSFWGGQVETRYKKTSPNVQLLGETPGSFPARNWSLREGRLLVDVDVDGCREVCVLGDGLAKTVFPHSSPLGEPLKINGINYMVVGVLEPKGGSLNGDQDNFAIVPVTTGLNRFGRWRSLSILVQSRDQAGYDDTLEQARGALRAIRKVPPGKEDDFEIFSNDSMIAQFNSFTFAVRVGVTAVSSISLLAAGIGIMNIMLVSVTERTREIGIRRAVGAKKRSIMTQFIMEAIVICEVGGLIGVVLGILGGNATAYFLKLAPVVPVDWVVIGLVICSIVGIVFGTYPAYKAANLDPIESLRYE
ncbi:MAG TPA: ABC transporter permease [Candidatus Binatia bacterium]|jgi:putative ABC transport system permease protein|nr:ABC transporter permease [Candidatus Binatia bacterium]